MKTKIFFTVIFLYLLFCSTELCAQQENDNKKTFSSADKLGSPPEYYEILSENGRIIIPFEFYRNKFRFQASINGHTCYLLLDNGSLWDELLFFGSPEVDALEFNISGETSLGNSKADIAENITVGFRDIVFHDQTAVITRYNPDLPNLWEGFQGQVSATFFKHFVVKIDFDNSVIELIPPDQFNYTGKGQSFSMQPGPFSSRTINADIITHEKKTVTLELLIDLGGLHPVYLAVGRDDGITLPSDAKETSLGEGLFSQKGYMATVPCIKLGDYSLYNVPTAFSVVEKNMSIYGNTMVGLPLLRKFNIIFDYFNERIILEPSQSFNQPFFKN